MKNKKSILVFTLNSFFDPLFYATVVVYLKALNKDKMYNFYVISYEQKEYERSQEELKKINKELAEYNIFRYSFKYTSGKFILVKKTIEFIKGFLRAGILVIKYRPKAILALANLAGAFSYFIAKIYRIKLIVFTFEPHSEFMRDCGVWSERSLKFKMLNKMENKMSLNADYLATGTTHMIKRLKAMNTSAKLYLTPSCIDEEQFIYKPISRIKIREKLNITHKHVFIYLGKFGDLYYKEEIAILFNALQASIPNSFFIILTPNKKADIENLFTKHNVHPNNYFISKVMLEEVPDYISASDMGIVAVPPLGSQKYRSPIKVGEYLACGIPYIVCKGVSEDDSCALKNNVGVVLNEFSKEELILNHQQILKYLNEDKFIQRERCRNTGIAYRGKQIVADAFSEIFKDVFL